MMSEKRLQIAVVRGSPEPLYFNPTETLLCLGNVEAIELLPPDTGAPEDAGADSDFEVFEDGASDSGTVYSFASSIWSDSDANSVFSNSGLGLAQVQGYGIKDFRPTSTSTYTFPFQGLNLINTIVVPGLVIFHNKVRRRRRAFRILLFMTSRTTMRVSPLVI
jgi:hypothetical protein